MKLQLFTKEIVIVIFLLNSTIYFLLILFCKIKEQIKKNVALNFGVLCFYVSVFEWFFFLRSGVIAVRNNSIIKNMNKINTF